MADWNLPTLTTLYADVLTELKGRDETALKMDGSGTNLPAGAKKLNAVTGQFEQFDGTAWSPITSYAKTDTVNKFTAYPQDIQSDTNDIGYFGGVRQDGTRQYLLGATGSTAPLDLRSYDIDGTTILGRIYCTSSGNIGISPKSGTGNSYVYSDLFIYPNNGAIRIYNSVGQASFLWGRATDGTSSGWYVGRGNTTSDDIYFNNYVAGAGLNLTTNGGLIKANGNEIWHAGNDDSIQKAENELIGTVDFNTIVKPGNYRVNTSGNTYTNAPETAFQGVLVVNGASPSSGYNISTQMLFSYNTNKVYYRTMWETGNWTAWKEVVEKGANWISVTLLNGHTGDLFYCKIGSAVYLKGVVNTTNATSYTIGALPADIVPSYATTMFIQPLVYDSTAFARIQIASDGTINLPPSAFNVGSIAMNLNYITDQ